MASETMRSDARLSDVCFVDPQRGWAVGDRGVIWHTEDGGKNWYVQESGVSCSLTSVCFLDARRGWAVGGQSYPYTHTSTGVLLVTRDGGRQWTRDRSVMLPALRQVRFFDDRHGWAIGAPSAMFPSGLFLTDNGGRSWNPLPGEKAGGWLAADFVEPHNGALAGRSGAAATVRRGSIEPLRTLPFGLRSLTRMKLVPPVYGWLIGQGGLVMMTGDLGASWQEPPGELPRDMIGQFDFDALEVRGPQAWIAGTPGSRILHSPDAGRSWDVFSTGQPLPIHGLAFADDQHGWAVGELGTILATSDGGRTWNRQRAGGTRAALLGLFGEPHHVPWELLARLSGNEGYLGVVELLNRRDWEVAERAEVPLDDRAHEAAVGAGACGARMAWQFPLRQPGMKLTTEQILGGWDLTNDRRGLQMLQAYLVRQIRQWRPELIVTHDVSPQGGDALDPVINRAVQQAVEQAADPTAFAEQVSQAGLEPWRVKRVFGVLGPGSSGGIVLTTSQLAARLGRTLTDVTAGPRSLVEDQFKAAPESVGFHLLVDRLSDQQSPRDFFSGIALYPGGDARRQLSEPAAESVQLVQRIAQKRRNMQALLERSEQDPQHGAELVAQTGDLTRGLDPDGAVQVLYHLSQRHFRNGQWPMAAETLELLVDRYPDHPLTRSALTWLVQYYASGEAAWRSEDDQRKTVREPSGALRSVRAVDFTRLENRPEHAANWAKQIAETQPELAAEPLIAFPTAAADRQRGLPRQAERYYLSRSRATPRDAWWSCAQGEQWLADPKGLPPKAVLNCAPAPSKPRLDGRLDESFWQQAKPAQLACLQREDTDWGGTVLLAYDSQFLYLAVHCRKAPGVKYEPTRSPRPRDPDLSSFDRVEVYLDLDRDYATYYRLVIDQRGFVSEDCWGDASWNPNWFITATSDNETWTAEAAIPLDQLTGQYPTHKTVWAIGIQRIVPGAGFQSWNQPAAARVMPEGFGYLIFE
jgi:photosystem II stability/assembly factor-like uncharacterized protein